jgi:molybdopterin/thiamine biosynthesis adenylyltransferase/rhodanese-related sulfurtransferase
MQEIKSYERYHRQMILKGFGEAGQEKLALAKVLVIGAGGLGCPALLYLAAAGVGELAVMDDDVVALHNLHRQPIYNMDDIGKPKAERIAAFLQRLNPDILVVPYTQRLTAVIALEIMGRFDIIIDGTDNFSSRYLINDACVLLNKPLVFGAVSQYEGQISIFNVAQKDEPAVNYRDLFPDPPAPGEVLNCAEAGVLGSLPGIIGTMQASETIKLITGIGQPLVNRLYIFNALNNQGSELILQKRKGSDSYMPSGAEAFRQTDYDRLCENEVNHFDIGVEAFDGWLKSGKARVIDVREYGEQPIVTEFKHEHVPLSQLPGRFEMTGADTVLFFCQTGVRSAQAARWVTEKYRNEKMVYSLQGGIINYNKQHV